MNRATDRTPLLTNSADDIEKGFQRKLQETPRDSSIHHQYADFLEEQGRDKEANQRRRLAVHLENPTKAADLVAKAKKEGKPLQRLRRHGNDPNLLNPSAASGAASDWARSLGIGSYKHGRLALRATEEAYERAQAQDHIGAIEKHEEAIAHLLNSADDLEGRQNPRLASKAVYARASTIPHITAIIAHRNQLLYPNRTYSPRDLTILARDRSFEARGPKGFGGWGRAQSSAINAAYNVGTIYRDYGVPNILAAINHHEEAVGLHTTLATRLEAAGHHDYVEPHLIAAEAHRRAAEAHRASLPQ